MKVCAVVVTFNRKLDLMNCIPALLSQTSKLDTILIIDNCSTDGTYDELVSAGYLKGNTQSSVLDCDKGNVELNYFRMTKNTGGAGGFHKGQELALETDSDWIWLMDDDGFPSPCCLEKLQKSAIKNNLKVINPIVKNVKEPKLLSFDLGGMKQVSEAVNASNKDGLIDNVANPFNGTLMHRNVITSIGLIKKEMFIWGDEQEYLLRLKKNNIEYATLVNAEFFHPEGKTSFDLFLNKYKIAIKPKKLEMNYYRNIGFLNKSYFNGLGIKFLILYVCYFLSKNDFKKAINFVRYYFDGWFNKYKLENIL